MQDGLILRKAKYNDKVVGGRVKHSCSKIISVITDNMMTTVNKIP